MGYELRLFNARLDMEGTNSAALQTHGLCLLMALGILRYLPPGARGSWWAQKRLVRLFAFVIH
jgi:hypothetical protein